MSTEYFSVAAKLPACAAGERVLTVADLARQFRVSRKTVSRWRRRGLIGRRFLFDGHRRIGFLQSTVDRFAADNVEQVQRGTRFARLTDEVRHQIIERARAITQAGASLMEVTRRIAQEMGRSPETIRCTLTRFDVKRPGMATFPQLHQPVPTETKRQILQQHRLGVSAEALAEQFCQTRTSIYRIIREMLAARIVELPLNSMGNEQFARLRSEKKQRDILGPMPECGLPAKKSRVPSGMPAYLASLYEVPLLTREQEAHLFRKMNYLKYLARKLRETLDLDRPKVRLMDRIEKLYEESVAIKNQIIRANLRLVVSIAKRYVGPAEEFFELVSDGNISLMRAAEKFDVSRGNRFSTYASWAIIKNFTRTISVALRNRDRFCTSHSEKFSTIEDARANQYEQESAQLRRESEVQRILKRLDTRERQIIEDRFGLARGQEPRTLKQVGAAMGITKERVRQIQTRTMGKLRQAAEEDGISLDLAIAGPASNPLLQHDANQWRTTPGGDQ